MGNGEEEEEEKEKRNFGDGIAELFGVGSVVAADGDDLGPEGEEPLRRPARRRHGRRVRRKLVELPAVEMIN